MAQKLTSEIITAAIAGFEQQKQSIDAQLAELHAMLTGGVTGGATSPAAVAEPTKRKRRKMSAAGRASIAEAQRKRWAVSKGRSVSKGESKAAPAAPKKRQMSAAGRKAISVATKKRWALKRAEAGKAKPAATRKTSSRKAAVKEAVA